jgi:FKBP-type peptidyl-prolyl cis-trans isomerase FkpA
MLKSRILFGLILLAAGYTACKKIEPYNSQAQLEIDDAIIAKYLVDSNLKDSGFVKDPSGLYYKIQRMGAGTDKIIDESVIYANYTVKVLTKPAYDRRLDSAFTFTLPGYIEGVQKGITKIKVGGKIRMLIPSPLAYQQRYLRGTTRAGRDTILVPSNSILDYTLEILSLNKKP